MKSGTPTTNKHKLRTRQGRHNSLTVWGNCLVLGIVVSGFCVHTHHRCLVNNAEMNATRMVSRCSPAVACYAVLPKSEACWSACSALAIKSKPIVSQRHAVVSTGGRHFHSPVESNGLLCRREQHEGVKRHWRAVTTASASTAVNFRVWPKGGGLVHSEATVDESAVIEQGAVVNAKASVGAGTTIGCNSVIGEGVRIGNDCRFWYNVSVSNCTIGNNVILHHGVSIGADGFGFTVDNQGKMVKKPQELSVVVKDHVEVGANSCIDRGSWRDTVIGEHTKIDNLVQIGHNVVTGRCCILCGQVGIAGSVTLGDYVVMGGKSGVADHVDVCSKVRVAATSGVTKDITEPGDYGGFPAMPAREWKMELLSMRKLAREADRIMKTVRMDTEDA
eukprot:jgi/Mesvir1/16550/Mv10091-RA.1